MSQTKNMNEASVASHSCTWEWWVVCSESEYILLTTARSSLTKKMIMFQNL